MWAQGKAFADGRQAWGGGKEYLSRLHNTPSETAAAGRFCSPTLGKGPEDLTWWLWGLDLRKLFLEALHAASV